jgi:hypothetical protein
MTVARPSKTSLTSVCVPAPDTIHSPAGGEGTVDEADSSDAALPKPHSRATSPHSEAPRKAVRELRKHLERVMRVLPRPLLLQGVSAALLESANQIRRTGGLPKPEELGDSDQDSDASSPREQGSIDGATPPSSERKSGVPDLLNMMWDRIKDMAKEMFVVHLCAPPTTPSAVHTQFPTRAADPERVRRPAIHPIAAVSDAEAGGGGSRRSSRSTSRSPSPDAGAEAEGDDDEEKVQVWW